MEGKGIPPKVEVSRINTARRTEKYQPAQMNPRDASCCSRQRLGLTIGAINQPLNVLSAQWTDDSPVSR